jgi:hypothetical protein
MLNTVSMYMSYVQYLYRDLQLMHDVHNLYRIQHATVFHAKKRGFEKY